MYLAALDKSWSKWFLFSLFHFSMQYSLGSEKVNDSNYGQQIDCRLGDCWFLLLTNVKNITDFTAGKSSKIISP